jgi:hypothetical protein
MADYLTNAEINVKTYLETHDIPTYFYQCFFGELVKVFGVKFLIPDTSYLDTYDGEEDYSYKEQIGYFLTCEGGTGGWYEAFSATCDQCGLMDIYDDYSNMDWVHSDIFDGYIADKMLDVLFADTRRNDYYKFKIQKENEL